VASQSRVTGEPLYAAAALNNNAQLEKNGLLQRSSGLN
jgi:hypothetical protein